MDIHGLVFEDLLDLKKKVVKKLYIYRDSRLPEEGWMQSCFRCFSYTNGSVPYDVIDVNEHLRYEIYVYCCASCKNTVDSSEKEYLNLVNRIKLYLHNIDLW